MLEQMSSRLFAEWNAYYNLEKFGDELIDMHFARLAAIQVSTKKNPVSPDKYRLWQKIVKFDPQEYFDGLKAAFTFSKKE